MNELTLTALPDLASQINTEHEQAREAMKSSLTHARACGDLLIQAKALVNHGDWLPWLAANCAFSDRTARAYMRVAANWPELEKSATVANLTYREALGLLAEPKQDEPKDFDGAMQDFGTALNAALDASQAQFIEWDERLETADLQECIAISREAGDLHNAWAELRLRYERWLGEMLNEIERRRNPDHGELRQAEYRIVQRLGLLAIEFRKLRELDKATLNTSKYRDLVRDDSESGRIIARAIDAIDAVDWATFTDDGMILKRDPTTDEMTPVTRALGAMYNAVYDWPDLVL